MICSSCGTETNGIKLNEKIFCTNCGEVLSIPKQVEPEPIEIEPETKSYSAPREFEPTAKVIDVEGNQKKLEKEIETLEAEEEVIDLITKDLKSPKKGPKKELKNTEIKKHNRPRVFHQRSDDFKVYLNEPNPIKDPELEVPHDDLITEKSEEENEPQIVVPAVEEAPGTALLEDEVRQRVEAKKAVHRKAFVGFLKSGTSQATAIKKKKEKDHHYRKLMIVLGATILFIIGSGAFIYYMNNFGLNPDHQATVAEKSSGMSIKRPGYTPPGYALSFLTSGQKDSINYVYEYLPDKNKRIDVIVTKTNMSEDELFASTVKSSGKNYEETTEDDTRVWYIDNKIIVFVKNGLSFQVMANTETAKGTLFKMIEGML
jgi:hypothetical protein